MPISRELIRQIRHLDVYDLRRLQMLIQGLLVGEEALVPAAPDGSSRAGKVTFRQEHVRCGKKACPRCPHGPYWYAYWREDGRTRSRYVGKTLPGDEGSSGRHASPD